MENVYKKASRGAVRSHITLAIIHMHTVERGCLNKKLSKSQFFVCRPDMLAWNTQVKTETTMIYDVLNN